MLRRALEPVGVPVLGALRRDDAFTWRDRHLGLVPVVEQADAIRRSLGRLAEAVAASVDLDAVLALASTARPMEAAPPVLPVRGGHARVAVASGAAFDFVYRDNLEALEAAGAELLPFDPLTDAALPDGTEAVYAGGGFPEVFAPALAENLPLLEDVRRRDVVIWAECGGLLWLARSLDGHPMAGLVEADAHMTDRLTLGYRRAVLVADGPLGPAGAELRGHEFHYSTVEPAGTGLALHGRGGSMAGGFVGPRLFASYLHLHLGGDPASASRLVAAVR
jgi:cobyrinic acid a,c-diamide synthase